MSDIYTIEYSRLGIRNFFNKNKKSEMYETAEMVYNRFNELSKKRLYDIIIYKNNNLIDFADLLNDFINEISNEKNKMEKEKELIPEKKMKFQKGLDKGQERLISVLYDERPLFSIYIEENNKIGLYDIDVRTLMWLMDTDTGFKLSFGMLTDIINSKQTIDSRQVLRMSIRSIMKYEKKEDLISFK